MAADTPPPPASGAGLLPCPFCGEPPDVSTYKTESLFSHDIVTFININCGECDCAHVCGEQHDEVRQAWNRRASRTSAATGWEDITWNDVCDELGWARTTPCSYHLQKVMDACNAIARGRLAGEQATGGAGLQAEEPDAAMLGAWAASLRDQARNLREAKHGMPRLLHTAAQAEAIAAYLAARAHPAPAPSAPGAGGGLTAEELDRLERLISAEGKTRLHLTRKTALLLIAAARRAEPAAPAPGGGGGPDLPCSGCSGPCPHRGTCTPRAPTPDAPVEPGQGGEPATWRPLDDNGYAELCVNGKRITTFPSYPGAEEAAQRINAALSTPPADAVLREALEQCVKAISHFQTPSEIMDTFMSVDNAAAAYSEAWRPLREACQAAEAALAPSAPPSPADGAPEVEG